MKLLLNTEILKEIDNTIFFIEQKLLEENGSFDKHYEMYGDTIALVGRNYSENNFDSIRKEAISEFEENFEHYNNWICPSYYDDYNQAKESILNYIKTL